LINSRYQIIKLLGEGRSKVFLCLDKQTNQNITLKILSQKAYPEEKIEFKKEFFLLKKLNHSNIIQVYNYGHILELSDSAKNEYKINNNDSFFTLEYFEGLSLDHYVDNFSNKSILQLINLISNVLFYLHQSNFIYYDLKPENILIRFDDDHLSLKFIDFGLTRHCILDKEKNIIGSTKFIAPEILNNEERNYKADLYSLGVLLYRLAYKKYPFNFEDSLEIYKAQVDGVIDFPKADISNFIVESIKTLLQKESSKRFKTSLHLIKYLGLQLPENCKTDWKFISSYTGRMDVLKLVFDYVDNPVVYQPILINGTDGSGKTTLLTEITKKSENALLINTNSFDQIDSLEKQLLSLIFFTSNVYNEIDAELKLQLHKILSSKTELQFEEFRSIFSKISKSAKFTLLIDDYDVFHPMLQELLTQIIPLLIVNGNKVIVTTTSAAEKIFSNYELIELKPFSENELHEFIDTNFSEFMPYKKLKEYAFKYSDLLPGSIIHFIEKLVHDNILTYDDKGSVIIKEGKNIQEQLRQTHTELFVKQYSLLNENELIVLNYLALLKTRLRNELMLDLLGFTKKEFDNVVSALGKKNIIELNANEKLSFYSAGLRELIKSRIKNLNEINLNIANWMILHETEISPNDIAFHYELAEQYDKTYYYYSKEFEKAKQHSLYKYASSIVNHLLDLPLSDDLSNKLKIELSDLYFLQGDYNSSFSVTEELWDLDLSIEEKNKLMMQKGTILINLGKFQDGIDLLEKYLQTESISEKVREVQLNLVNAYLYLNNFEKAESLCYNIINDNSACANEKGKAYNVLGVNELLKNNNPLAAIEKFNMAVEYYKNVNVSILITGVQVNIGSAYLMLGEYDKAETVWENTLSLIKEIGNLAQEGNLLLNYGILKYDKCDFDKSIDQYERARIIFINIGYKNNIGLAMLNLAEANLTICNYSKSVEYLEYAIELFEIIQNYGELAECLILKSKLCFQFRHKEDLQIIIEKLSSLIGNGLISEVFYRKINLLRALHLILQNNIDDACNLLEEFKKDLYSSDEREDNINFAYAVFKLLELKILQKNYNNVDTLINDDKLKYLSNKNILVFAERNYWLAKVKLENNESNILDLLNSAFDKLERISITSISWKVIFLIGLFFEKRGNLSKAEKYFFLSNSIINEISKKCSNSKFTEHFLSLPDVEEIHNHVNNFSIT
jgi:serine/threonine protein kinase